MKRLFLSVLAITLSSTFAFAQLDFNDFLKELPQGINGTNFAVKQTTVVKGSPFLYEDWVNGQILASARKTETVPIKVNYADNYIVVQNNGNPVYLGFNQIDGLELYTPQQTIFKTGFPYSDKQNIEKTTMMEVIYDGGIKVLRKHYVKLSKSVATYGTANREDVYKKYDELLVLNEAGEYKEIKLKKKDILRLFDKDKRKDIESFAKSKSLSFKDETGVKVIMQYAESI